MTKQEELAEQFWKSLENSPFVMLGLAGVDAAHTQPMTAQIDKDLNNCLYFFTDRQNRLVQSFSESRRGVINFSSKGHDLFACVHGTLSVDNDRAMIDQFWSPVVAAWYDDGKDSPDLTMLRFDLISAQIWNASTASFFKTMIAGYLGDGAVEKAQEDVIEVRF